VNVFLKRLLIIAIALAVIAPAIYYAITLNNANQRQSDPLYYAPSDTNVLGYVNYNGTHFYVYANNRSYGLIFDTSSLSNVNFSRISSLMHGNGMNGSTFNSSSNFTSKTNISLYADYKDYSIYVIRNLSFAFIGLSITNQTLYLYESNGFIVLGNLNGIYESINATLSSRNAIGYSGYLNSSANVSMAVFNVGNKIVKSVYFNLTGNNLTGSIRFLNYTYESYFLSAISNMKGAKIISVHDFNVKFKLDIRSLISAYDLMGVLNAQ